MFKMEDYYPKPKKQRGNSLVKLALEMLLGLLVAFCAVGFVAQNFHGGTNPPYDPSIHVGIEVEHYEIV